MRNYATLSQGAYALGKALASAPGIEKAYERRAMADAMRNALGQARTRKYLVDAALGERQLASMDEGRDRFLQGATGLSQPQIAELTRNLRNGWMKQAAGPPAPTIDTKTGDPMLEFPTMRVERPAWYTPDVEQRFRQANMALGAAQLGTGKTNAEKLMAALQTATNLGRQDRIIAGEADPAAIARAMAATAGKPTVDVTASGIAFNPYGDKNDLNTQPFMARIAASAKGGGGGSGAGGGRRLGAQAGLIRFLVDEMKIPEERAIELAFSRKNTSVRDLMAQAYQESMKSLMLSVDQGDMSDAEFYAMLDKMAQESALRLRDFLLRYEGADGAPNAQTGNDDPLGLRP